MGLSHSALALHVVPVAFSLFTDEVRWRALYCVEICPSPEDEPDDRYDGFGFGESWVCPDCDGEGIEFLADLIEQTCETCRGSGVVAWVER